MKEKDSCDGEKASEREKLGNETVIGKKTMKNKEIRNDCEAEDGGKNKKKKKKGKRYNDEIGRSMSSKVVTPRKTGRRKQDDIDFGAVEETENFNKEMKKKSKKKRQVKGSEGTKDSTRDAKKESKEKKQNEDSKADEATIDFLKDAEKEIKKKKKRSKNSVAEEGNKDSRHDGKQKREKKQGEVLESVQNKTSSMKDGKKKKKKKRSEGSEIEEGNKNSEKDAEKKRKKKQIEDPEAEQNTMESMEDGKKKRKKKRKCNMGDENMTTSSSKRVKRVKFSDQVKVFPSEDEKEEAGGDGLVRGKRFTKEEDELIKKAIQEYIDNNGLGDKGLNMVLRCGSHPEIKDCWKYIAYALPWRPQRSIYMRAQTLFERSKGKLTRKELEYVKQFVESRKWQILAESLGKHVWRVKDAWRRMKFPDKGKWSREEYQTLFDLVNNDLRLKAFQEKKSRHGMLRDNIHWTAISDQLGTRYQSVCCAKWYSSLTSPMVAKGIWASVDDYRLLDELMKLDATCIDDVDWDNLLESRDGEICRKRWNQMVLHIGGVPGTKTFVEQVEILSNRYCPDLAEDRENFDNRPYDDLEAPLGK